MKSSFRILSLLCALSGTANSLWAQSGSADALSTHLARARQALQQKHPEQAIPELQAAAQIDPKNVEIQGNLGVLLFFQGRPAEAVPHLRAAVLKQPSLSKLQGILGIAEVHTQDLESGRKDLETAFPHLEDAKFRLEAGMELVNLYSSSGDLDKAASIVDKLRAENPTDPRILYTAYRIHSDLAGEAMLTLSLAAPNSAEMHQIMAHEKLHYGDQDGAIAQFRIAVKEEPKSSALHFELAEALSGSNAQADRTEAEHEYRLALELNPNDERAERKLGDIELEHEHVKEAYAHYAHAVQLVPTDLDAKLGLAMTLLQMERRDEAKALIEDVLHSEPENYMAHFFLSKVYWREGRKEDAQKEVELYKKYKEMKEKMRAIYRDLRLAPQDASHSDTGEAGKPADSDPKR